MDDTIEAVAGLMREAGEVHHRVYRITDGADEDWASWYADWLVNRSELPELLSRRPVRSELTAQLVALDKAYAAEQTTQAWDRYYAEHLVRHFV